MRLDDLVLFRAALRFPNPVWTYETAKALGYDVRSSQPVDENLKKCHSAGYLDGKRKGRRIEYTLTDDGAIHLALSCHDSVKEVWKWVFDASDLSEMSERARIAAWKIRFYRDNPTAVRQVLGS